MQLQLDEQPLARPWQFSLCGLFWFLTVLACLIAVTQALASDPVAMATRMMGGSIIATAVLSFFAWRRMRDRPDGPSVSNREAVRERFAFASGLISILPYGCIWLFILIEPLESHWRFVHEAMGALFSVCVLCYLPVLVALIISLILNWKSRENSTLLAMRLIGLFANAWLLPTVLLAIAGSV